MPRRKSSEKANTTDKIFSHEQVKNLTILQLMEMENQGWRVCQDPAPPWGSYNYQAPGFDPAKDMISPPGDTYVAGTVPRSRRPGDPELEALRADPEMQQMAAGMGVTVDDLLLLREMMLDRFASRYGH